MTMRISSFLVRCWQLSSGSQRIEIEHIQTGEKARFRTLPEGMEWIRGHQGSAAVPKPAPVPVRREDEGPV
jgi:hypothetical protein